MPSFLSSKKCTFIKTSKKAKAAAVGEKKRPASASSLKSETHSNSSSTATVRPIQVQESEDGSLAKEAQSQHDEVTVIEETLKECIDDYNKGRKDEVTYGTDNVKMSKSKSDTGFNHMVSPVQHVQRTESYGDIKSLHVVKPGGNAVSPRNTLEVTSQSRGERSLTMSRNRREATYCKYLLRNAAHRRSQSRLSQKLSKLDSMGNNMASNEQLRQHSTPSELTSVTSLSSFGSVSSFHSANSITSGNAGTDTSGNLARVLAKENKVKMTALLVLARRRQLARDDLAKFTMSDVAVCGARIDRAFVQQQEELHYSGVIYPIKIVSTDDLMFPNRKFSLQIQCSTQQELHQSQKMTFENDYKISSSLPPHPNVAGSHARFQDTVPSNLPGFPTDPSGSPLVTDTTFVISDFLSDSNLRTFLRDNAHLIEYKVEEFEYSVCLLLLQLFRALHHLHDNKVVHRDLKLENVIIGNADHPGGGKRLCVTNFGYALHQQDKAEHFIVNLDDPNVRLGGNLHHLPPEILNPPDDVNELDYTKSDVFGAGCMIYEMLNLQNPFEADEGLAMRNYTQADLPLIPKRSRYSYALDRLVCLLLRNKPSKRISAKRAGDLVEVMLWGPEELRGADRTAAEQMAAEWLEQQRAEMLSNLALKLAENFTPHGARVVNNSGFSLEDELKCRFLRETSSRALTTNLYLLSQCQRGQRT